MTQAPKALIALAATSLLGGCLSKVNVVDVDAGPVAADGGALLGTCVRGGYCSIIDVSDLDKLDLLFVVDNSASMTDEQTALAAAIPQLSNALASGRFDPDDDAYPRAKDMHFGVVSTDLGLPGVTGVAGCSSDDGDGARMQHEPHGMGCDSSYPLFLSFNGNELFGPTTDPSRFADDMACIARLGNQGCGYVQPLEAALKAVWPSIYTDEKGNVVDPNPIRFSSTAQSGMLGLGDTPQSLGGNLGFLRMDPVTGPALTSIVVVSDGEDCSMRSSDPFAPNSADPDVNLRCFHNQDVLFDVDNRYGVGLSRLHPGRPDLVTFNAIVGVPVDLVDEFDRDKVDMRDDVQRNLYYDNILNDPRMQEALDPSTNVGHGSGNLVASCVRSLANGSVSTAFPPRRIVELAKELGTSGMVQSICQDDLGPAMKPIFQNVASHLGEKCLSFELKRDDTGRVACDVIWQLPTSSQPGSGTPTSCDDEPFLQNTSGSRKPTNDRGGRNCVIKQLATTDLTAKEGDGWYYDDFSADAAQECPKYTAHRIAFSPAVKPPVDVQVVLDCEVHAKND